jgi:hypothetical protein
MGLGAALSRGEDDRSPWRALADGLCELPDVDTAAVFVVDDVEERLIPRHVSGRHARDVEQLSIPVGERMSGWVAAVDQPMINADAALDLFDTQAESLHSALAIPCRGSDGARSVVALYSTRAEAFGAVHQRLIEAAMGLISHRGTPSREIRDDRRTPRRPWHRRPRAWRTWDEPNVPRAHHRSEPFAAGMDSRTRL